MLKPEQIPNEVWTELALRLESCGAVVSDQVARLAACVVINAWPHVGLSTHVEEGRRIILPLPKEPSE